MRRTTTFEVVPQSEQADTVLRRLLDASASLWNQLTYARRQQFFAGERARNGRIPDDRTSHPKCSSPEAGPEQFQFVELGRDRLRGSLHGAGIRRLDTLLFPMYYAGRYPV
jgi:hypothetical protein